MKGIRSMVVCLMNDIKPLNDLTILSLVKDLTPKSNTPRIIKHLQ